MAGSDLDRHLAEMFQTTTLEENGMPSLEWLRVNFNSKSAIIRFLGGKGFGAKEIAQHLDIKYQHARNVLTQHLKRGPNETYIDSEWACSHTKAIPFVDVIVRNGMRDPNSTRVLFRVCTVCALDLIPGVTSDSLNRHVPGSMKAKT